MPAGEFAVEGIELCRVDGLCERQPHCVQVRCPIQQYFVEETLLHTVCEVVIAVVRQAE